MLESSSCARQLLVSFLNLQPARVALGAIRAGEVARRRRVSHGRGRRGAHWVDQEVVVDHGRRKSAAESPSATEIDEGLNGEIIDLRGCMVADGKVTPALHSPRQPGSTELQYRGRLQGYSFGGSAIVRIFVPETRWRARRRPITSDGDRIQTDGASHEALN